MSTIYRYAESVLIFLGDGPDCSAMYTFCEGLKRETYTREMVDSDVLHAFYNLVNMPWWSRVWVIQEFAYATGDALLGYNHHWTDAQTFLDAFEFILQDFEDGMLVSGAVANENLFIDRNTMMPFARAARTWHTTLRLCTRAYPETYLLLDLLMESRSHRATDPRDKVFALQSLMMEPLRSSFAPDYTISLTTVYTRMAAYLLCIEKWTGMYEPFPISTNGALPSWVPDFSVVNPDDWELDKPDKAQSMGQLECSVSAGIRCIRVIDCGEFLSGRGTFKAHGDGNGTESTAPLSRNQAAEINSFIYGLARLGSDGESRTPIALSEVAELCEAIFESGLAADLISMRCPALELERLIKAMVKATTTSGARNWELDRLLILQERELRMMQEQQHRLGYYKPTVDEIEKELRWSSKRNKRRKDEANQYWTRFRACSRVVPYAGRNARGGHRDAETFKDRGNGR